MENLDKDRLFLIAVELDLPSLLKFCETNKRISNLICKQPYVWIEKLKRDFNADLSNLSREEFYKAEAIYKVLYKLQKNPKNYISSEILYDAIETGSLDLVQDVYFYFEKINQKILKYHIEEYFVKAAEVGKLDIIDFFISEGAKAFDAAFLIAIENNNFTLMQKFLPKNQGVLNQGLNLAAKKGNKNTVNYLLNNGADDMNEGLQGAAQGGHEDLVDFFISKGANDWNLAVTDAIVGGNENIIAKLLPKVSPEYIPIVRRQAASKRSILDLTEK